jgi:hypothetical protein
VLSEEARRNQLMAALSDHELVKAALVVNPSGTIKGRVGTARSLKSSAGGTDQFGPVSGQQDLRAKENVYLVGAGEDFLIAIFDDGVDFDGVKKDVDSLIEDLEY